MNDDALWSVYQQVVFVIIDAPPQADYFTIITADYPQGQVLDEISRKQREQKLYETLKCYSQPCRLYGCSADLKHRELSFAVTSISFEQTLKIARDYYQNAFYEVQNNQLYLHTCLMKYRPKVCLGNFSVRCITEP